MTNSSNTRFTTLKHHNELTQDTVYVRIKNNLYDTGFGIVLFSFWNIFKTIMFACVDFDQLMVEVRDDASPAMMTLTIAFFIIISGISTALGAYVGTSAMAIARGGRRSKLYAVIAIFMLFVSFTSLFAILYILITTKSLITILNLRILVSIIVEITSDFLYISMLIMSYRLKKYIARFAKEVPECN